MSRLSSEVVCPYCGATVHLRDGRQNARYRGTMPGHHVPRRGAPVPRGCPAGEKTPARAQEMADAEFIHHAATGE